jgi:hypothetical protein
MQYRPVDMYWGVLGALECIGIWWAVFRRMCEDIYIGVSQCRGAFRFEVGCMVVHWDVLRCSGDVFWLCALVIACYNLPLPVMGCVRM